MKPAGPGRPGRPGSPLAPCKYINTQTHINKYKFTNTTRPVPVAAAQTTSALKKHSRQLRKQGARLRCVEGCGL